MVDIRVARRADMAAIDALLKRSYPRLLAPDYPPSVLVTAIPLIARANPELVGSGTYYIAEADGHVLGAGGWTPVGPMGQSAPDAGHIRHFVTDPDALRQGVARALMQRCLDDALRAGLLRLNCMSTRTAVPFYAAMGFVGSEEVAIELRPGITFPAVAMSMTL